MTLRAVLSITFILFLNICIAQQNPKIIIVVVSKNEILTP